MPTAKRDWSSNNAEGAPQQADAQQPLQQQPADGAPDPSLPCSSSTEALVWGPVDRTLLAPRRQDTSPHLRAEQIAVRSQPRHQAQAPANPVASLIQAVRIEIALSL
jgi:hypothetical protein